MSKTIIDDGFNAELVSNAFFDGLLEIPIIEKPQEIKIPSALIPFTQMKRSSTKSEAVHFYEHDKRFSDVLTCTKDRTDFINYPDWTSTKRRRAV